MNTAMLTSLLYNASLLLALGVLYATLATRPAEHSFLRQAVTGGLIGLIGLAVMLTPWQLAPGIVFDTRSILLSLSGLFFGPIPTGVAIIMTAGLRLYQGGAGAPTGVLVIVATAGLGLLWRRLRRPRSQTYGWVELYLFGLAAHILMLLCMLTLPQAAVANVLRVIAAPVLLVYPVATVFLGKLLSHQLNRFELEDAVQQRERRFRKLVEQGGDVIALADANGILTYVSDSTLRMFGYPDATEMIGASMMGFVHPEDLSLAEETFRSALGAAGVTLRATARGRRRDGAWLWMEIAVTNLLNDPAVGALVFNALDVTERRRAEEELRVALEKYRVLFESFPLGISITDAEGNIIEANEEAERLLGVRREEQVRRKNTSPEWRVVRLDGTLMPPEELASERAFRGKCRVEDVEMGVAREDGSISWISVTAAPIPLEHYGVAMTYGDISERKRVREERLEMERRLLHAQRLESLGVLAGGVAHDFNNLLMAILGNLDLALSDLPPAAAARPSVEQAIHAAKRAADLTRQLLAYSGKGRFVVQHVDLGDLVQENMHMLRAATSRNVALRLRLSGGPCVVMADAGQMQQVIMNLITNASEAVGAGVGVVELATGVMECDAAYLSQSRLEEKPAPGHFAWLEVRDTGCGMDAATQERLFDPFFTTKFMGRGLGMSAVLGIVRGHQGAILLQSEEGRGTTLRVLFPAVAPAQKQPASEARVSSVGAPASGVVLVVDDDEMVRDLGRRMVELLGYRSLSAADGAEALRLFSAHAGEIVVVVLDLTMPQMDGVATFHALRGIRPDVRVILCSGFNEQEATRRFAHQGLAGFVQKPYVLSDLRAALARSVKPTGAGENSAII